MRNRKQKTAIQRWREYERRKKQIEDQNLSPAEYEAEIRALAERLKV